MCHKLIYQYNQLDKLILWRLAAGDLLPIDDNVQRISLAETKEEISSRAMTYVLPKILKTMAKKSIYLMKMYLNNYLFDGIGGRACLYWETGNL